MDISDKLLQLASGLTNIAVEKLSLSTTLSQMNMDSLDVMEFIMAVEDQFNVIIVDNASIKCINDLYLQIMEQESDFLPALSPA